MRQSADVILTQRLLLAKGYRSSCERSLELRQERQNGRSGGRDKYEMRQSSDVILTQRLLLANAIVLHAIGLELR